MIKQVLQRLRAREYRELLSDFVEPEMIGHEDCPMMVRWTLFYRWGVKITIHHFPPDVDDKDPHDHPSAFLTFVLKGGYFNTEYVEVDLPDQKYMEEVEWIGRGRIVYRPAEHMHIVETNHLGAWTLVIMGPKERPWGFLRLKDRQWWFFEDYIERFGGVARCETDDGHREVPRPPVPTPGPPDPPDHSKPRRHE